ncbi:MAG: kelch repeat-containing protein [FCB group bacterium]
MKSLFTILCLLTLTLTFANSQWTAQSSFPGQERRGAFSFTIGDKAYIGGGKADVMINDFWEYDSKTSRWTQLTNLPIGPRAWAFAFAINGKGYFGCGDTTTNISTVASDFWEYDPDSDTWTRKADFEGDPRYGTFCFVLNEKAYVGTGYNGNFVVSDYWQYDPVLDVWTEKGNYPGANLLFPGSFVLNNKAYVVGGIGGLDGISGVNLMYEYTDGSNTWKKCANYPGDARGAGVAFAMNGKGYYGLGESQYQFFYKDMWEYNPGTDIWTESTNLTYPGDHVSWTTSFVIGTDAYICTGASFSGMSVEVVDSIYKYSFPPTQVNEVSINDEIYISPNPVSDEIKINGAENQIIKIFTSEGIKILETRYNGSLDLSSFANGLYFLNANGKNYKFVIFK